MSKLLNVSSSPHVRDQVTTSNIMLDVAIAMIPATAYGVYQFGIKAALVILVTVLSCVLSEYVYETLMGKPVTISDGSALVTGMILALNMPPGIPLWIPVLGGIFAIIVVKQLYGGLGQNFMNPALAARCFLLIAFAGKMTTFTYNDAVVSPTPLAALKAGQAVDIPAMFIGKIPGTIGEVSVIALLIGAAYLLIKKVITIRIPAAYLITFAVFVFIFGHVCACTLMRRRPHLRCVLHGYRLCNQPDYTEGPDPVRYSLRCADRPFPVVRRIRRGRFLCDHHQQHSGAAD